MSFFMMHLTLKVEFHGYFLDVLIALENVSSFISTMEAKAGLAPRF